MPTLICAGCGHVNGAEARFCEECGSSLAPRCSACGAELSPTARFCSGCGTARDKAPVAAGALKVVSVVFSDLLGSTALQEALEPESARRVMARFYEAMLPVVERHGGAIQKFIGDAVVAVFGVPSVGEDDALRAVRCAVAMNEALEQLNEELARAWGVRLEIRTGVNTGELAISGEGIFVGDTMNTAARLEQAADGGAVLLGEATWRLVRHDVELAEIAPLELKGKAGPVRAWRVVSTQPPATAAAESPLIGRSRELDRLRSALEQAISARACRLVTVIGSPGLGKSRLAGEFARSLGEAAVVLEGHCESTGEGITFLPVADVLRSAASIAEDDRSEQVLAKLTEIVPEGPDRDRVVAGVAGLLGAGAPAAPEEAFWGIRTVLESLGRERPLVVVLDDLHWGQPMFLDLIEHLVEWVRDAAILLVALARPELRETRTALATIGRRALDVIELEPLEPDESRELVGGLLGELNLPDQLLERILETTEGNPLFLGEVLRMLVDEGALERQGEVWVAARGAEAVQVPPTVQALLSARIERLRTDERSVVERAAVIGKQFYRGAVAELVTAPIRSRIDRHLETLRRKDMVEPEGTYWVDEPVYRFHHVLIRDAAYHLLLKEARAELHEKFADWLETKAGELVGEHEEVIAYHLEQAHEYRRQLGPLDDRGRALGSRAARRLASAGRRALAREDLSAAANLLQRALDRDPGSDVRWDLGEALLSAGDTARAAEVIGGLSGWRGEVLAAQLAVLTGTGSLDETLERVSAATDALASADDATAEAKGHHVTAQMQAQLGRVADVEASLDRALLAARRADDRRRITAVLAAAPRAALWGPSPIVRASGRCLDVVRILRMTPGHRHVEAVALRCQAVLEAMRGRVEAAREILAGGRATLEELGLTLELQELATHAGIVELLAGEPGVAETLLRSARDGFAELGLSVSSAQAAALLGRSLVEQGRDEEALAETAYAEEHAGGDLKTTITRLGVGAEALARRGDTDRALELARRAVELAEPTDALSDKADAYVALARVLRDAGLTEEARSAAEAAGALYTAKDHAVGVQRAGELAEARAGGPRRPARVGTIKTIADPAVAAVTARYVALVAARDIEGFVKLHAPGWAQVDHRQLAWDERDDIRMQIEPAFEASADLRFDVDEVLACAPGVAALRTAWRGHSSDGGGEFELPVGYVITVRDGLLQRSEEFDVAAETSMRACFEDLRGRTLLGDRPPERWFRKFVDCFARRDAAGITQLCAENEEVVDRRALACETPRGAQGLVEAVKASWQTVPDIRCCVDEIVACDDRVMALRCTYRGTAADGGGPIEHPVAYLIATHGESGGHGEQLDHDDRNGMLARYRELGGEIPASLSGRPSERVLRELRDAQNARDYDRLAELIADDFSMADHRPLGWPGAQGRGQGIADIRSAFDASPDLSLEYDEILACDDRLIVTLNAWRGRGLKAGEHEVRAGAVHLIEDGRWAGVDFYEPDDRRAMIARYAGLGGGLGALGDSPPERWFAAWACRYAAGDFEGLEALASATCSLKDHRRLGWDPVTTGEGMADLARSIWSGAGDVRLEVDEVLACNERLVALDVTLHATSRRHRIASETATGAVIMVEEGRLVSWDQYDGGDRQAMLARFAELTSEPVARARWQPERLMAAEGRRYNAHDLDAWGALYAEDYVLVDHRAVGWGGLDRAALRENTSAAFRSAPDIRMEVDEVLACDERVIVARLAWQGHGQTAGPWRLPAGAVSVLRDGLWVRTDLYEPDDRRTMIARYAELGGGTGPLGDRPPEEFYRRWLPLTAAGDFDALAELVAEDFVRIDHRSLGWEPLRGREANVALWHSAQQGAIDIRMEVDEVLACDDRVIALRFTWRGVATGGPGEFAVSVGQVNVIEDGLWRSCDQYAPEDRAGMLARFAQLGGEHPPGVDGFRSERLLMEVHEALNAHDYERLAELVADDLYHVDHRALGWDEAHGRDQCLAAMRSAMGASPGVRIECDEVLAADEHVIVIRGAWRGTGVKAGELELKVGAVHVFKHGRWAGVDFYEPDDRAAMIARYADLGGGSGLYGNSPPEQAGRAWVRAYGTRDLDGLAGLVDDDWVLVDHRGLGWEQLRGREAWLDGARAAYAVFTDIRAEIQEVLARDDHVIALILSWRGTSLPDVGGGSFELTVGHVTVVEHGKFVSVDQYDADDREAILARFAELSGRTGC